MTIPNTEIPTPTILTPGEVESRLRDPADNVVLLDVRTRMERLIDGYIEGTTWIPLNQLQGRLQQEIPDDAEVVVYCAHGHRSLSVASYLLMAGYACVYDLQGGIANWQKAGLPVKRGL